MSNIDQIIEGTINNIFNREKEISQERLEICRKCPLHTIGLLGEMCNRNLWIDPKTDKISTNSKSGYYKGCGCSLQAKTKVKRSECPAGKW